MTEEEELRKQPLPVQHRHAYIRTYCEVIQYPLALTIAPNYAKQGGSKSVRFATSQSAVGQAQQLREVVKESFYQLDRAYSGCAKPHLLPPSWRFNGVVFPEGQHTNPHVHIILSCKNYLDQLWRYWFLLWAVNTSPANKDPDSREEDRYNEARAWRILDRCDRPWMAWNDPYGRSLFLPTLSFRGRRLAPASTAKVQLMQSYGDLENVLTYDTKKWEHDWRRSEQSKMISIDDLAGEIWELCDFFSPMGIDKPARCHRYDPLRPGDYLPPSGKRIWKSGRRVIT